MSRDGDIRAALALTIADISGLSTDDGGIRASAYVLDAVNPPIVMFTPGDMDYDGTFGHGEDTRPYTGIVIVGRVEVVSAQTLLDELRETSGTTSLKAAIEADRTLGGLVDGVQVTGFSGPRPRTYGEITYLSADVTVRVITN